MTWTDVGLLLAAPIAGYLIAAAARSWPDWRGTLTRENRPRFAAGLAACTAAATIALAAVMRTDGAHTPLIASVGWLLMFGALVDARTRMLPDVTTLGVAALAFTDAALRGVDALRSSAVGWIVGFGALWLVARLYRALRGRDGLGAGDAKLLGAAGALCGALALPWVVAGAAALTLTFVTVRGHVSDGMWTRAAPFGPALALATFAATLLR